MTSKFTGEQRQKATDLLIDNGDFLDIIPIEDFMTIFEPYEIAKMVKLSDLKLDCDYIRVNIYYSDTQEADAMKDLISDDEVEEALNQLQ